MSERERLGKVAWDAYMADLEFTQPTWERLPEVSQAAVMQMAEAVAAAVLADGYVAALERVCRAEQVLLDYYEHIDDFDRRIGARAAWNERKEAMAALRAHPRWQAREAGQ